MWYGVETAFVDGKHLGSQCLFQDKDPGPVGHCYADDPYPVNSCEKHFGGRIEIHVDWFETEELAHKFCNGVITYRHTYDSWNGRWRFVKRTIENVDPGKGVEPYRGQRTVNILKEIPWWAE